MANEFLSNLTAYYVIQSTSPWTYHAIENPMSGGNVGQTKPLVRVTNLGDTEERYIGGLADGDEFPLECAVDESNSPNVQDLIKAQFGNTIVMELWFKDLLHSPQVTTKYRFSAVVLQWQRNPSVGDADKMTFNFKISGSVTEV